MNTNRIIKLGLILLLFFCFVLIRGSFNVRMGGSILGYYSTLFYPLVIIAIIFLIYVATLKADYAKLSYAKLYVASILIITLYLITFIGIGDYPLDLDSIISTGSIDFILSQRYPSISRGDPELFIGATVSYPMLSILASTLELINGWTDVIVAKDLPLFLSILFLIIYFIFIKTYIGFQAALVSLVLLSTFGLMSSVSNTFVNVALANVYIVSGWLIFYKLLSTKLNIRYLLLLIYISMTFLLVHHLTFLAYILSIFAVMPIMLAFSPKLRFIGTWKITVIVLFLILILVGLFLNSPILSIIINTLTGKSSMAVAHISHYSTWPLKLMVLRMSYLLFVLTSLVIYASLTIRNPSWLASIRVNYSKFLVPGGFLIFCSFITILIHAPFGYERLAIFGWMLFIPGTIGMILENSPKIKSWRIIISFILVLVIIGNIYQISSGYIDHSGDKEYIEKFKNWVKPQEADSVLWMIAHDLNGSTIIGDELVWRLYNMNSPDFNGYWWSGKFSYKYIPEDFKKLYDLKGYLFIREENFYRIILSFSSLKYISEYRIEINEYHDLIDLVKYKQVYDNGEVTIFSRYA